MANIRTAILISGRGSNMLALIKAAQLSNYPAEIQLVISNRPGAAGLAKAQALGVSAITIDHTQFTSRREYEAALHQTLTGANIELICCAGFMRVLTAEFVSLWHERVINIHPSLLPKYKGLHTHKRVLEAGDSHHGCTVHYVTEDLDSGDNILQASIEVLPHDTIDSLAARLLPIENDIYIKALRQVARRMQSET